MNSDKTNICFIVLYRNRYKRVIDWYFLIGLLTLSSEGGEINNSLLKDISNASQSAVKPTCYRVTYIKLQNISVNLLRLFLCVIISLSRHLLHQSTKKELTGQKFSFGLIFSRIQWQSIFWCYAKFVTTFCLMKCNGNDHMNGT